MKSLKYLALAAFLTLPLTACEQDQTAPPNPDAPVIVDDECPRSDGEECK